MLMQPEQVHAETKISDVVNDGRFWADDEKQPPFGGQVSACRSCPHCLCVNFADAQVCRECQQPLAKVEAIITAARVPSPSLRPCPACGVQDRPDASYCRACGVALAGRGPRPARAPILAGLLGLWALIATGVAGYQALEPRAAVPLPIQSAAAPERSTMAASPPPVILTLAAPPPAPEAPKLRPTTPRVTRALMHRSPATTSKPAPSPTARPAPRLPTTLIHNPVWTSRPDAQDIARLYPSRALGEGRSGAATMDCRIAEGGGLEGCAVVSERPTGLGLGRATLKLSPLYRADGVSAAGWPSAGYRVRIPVDWRPPS